MLKINLKTMVLKCLISFNEFVVKFDQPIKDINKKLAEHGFIEALICSEASADFENHMLIAVTELRTKDEIDTFVKKAGELNGSK